MIYTDSQITMKAVFVNQGDEKQYVQKYNPDMSEASTNELTCPPASLKPSTWTNCCDRNGL